MDKIKKTMQTMIILCPVEPQGLVSIVVMDHQTQGYDKQCSAAIVQVI